MRPTKSINSKKKTSKASEGGVASVALWRDEFDEFDRMESSAAVWGDGFYDFQKALQALNAGRSPNFIQGNFEDDGFYMMSNKPRRID